MKKLIPLLLLANFSLAGVHLQTGDNVTMGAITATSLTCTGSPCGSGGGGAGTITGVTAGTGLSGGGTTGTVTVNLATPVSVANGGTGTASPGIVAGTNITSVTGTWPNQTINAAAGGATTNQNIRTVGASFDGGGATPTTPISRCILVGYGGTIQAATLTADISGSATVDIRTVSYSSFTGPSSASTITASATPTLSSATKYQDTTLTGWTTSLAANTMVCFYLTSASTVTNVSATIKVAAN